MVDFFWQKFGVVVDVQIQIFFVGDDVIFDCEFFLYDIVVSVVYVQGLQYIGIFSVDELVGLLCELDVLVQDFCEGCFVLDMQYEDGYLVIEVCFIECFGDVGCKIYIGCSCNDQILVVICLWLKEKLQCVMQFSVDVVKVVLDCVQVEKDLLIFGYIYIQCVVVFLVGMWWVGWVEVFIDNVICVCDIYVLVDVNLFGIVVGYGVNFLLDCEYIMVVFGFVCMQILLIYVQLLCGKFELVVLEVFGGVMLDLCCIVWDLLLFISVEFGFVVLLVQYIIGSLIMFNKCNLDVIELMCVIYVSVVVVCIEIEQLLLLFFGYYCDLQLFKGVIFYGFGCGLVVLELLLVLLVNLEWCDDRLCVVIDLGMYVIDVVVEVVVVGVLFCEVYKVVVVGVDSVGQGCMLEGSLVVCVLLGVVVDLCLDELCVCWQVLF